MRNGEKFLWRIFVLRNVTFKTHKEQMKSVGSELKEVLKTSKLPDH